jgi:hypothetical protein
MRSLRCDCIPARGSGESPGDHFHITRHFAPHQRFICLETTARKMPPSSPIPSAPNSEPPPLQRLAPPAAKQALHRTIGQVRDGPADVLSIRRGKMPQRKHCVSKMIPPCHWRQGNECCQARTRRAGRPVLRSQRAGPQLSAGRSGTKMGALWKLIRGLRLREEAGAGFGAKTPGVSDVLSKVPVSRPPN